MLTAPCTAAGHLGAVPTPRPMSREPNAGRRSNCRDRVAAFMRPPRPPDRRRFASAVSWHSRRAQRCAFAESASAPAASLTNANASCGSDRGRSIVCGMPASGLLEMVNLSGVKRRASLPRRRRIEARASSLPPDPGSRSGQRGWRARRRGEPHAHAQKPDGRNPASDAQLELHMDLVLEELVAHGARGNDRGW